MTVSSPVPPDIYEQSQNQTVVQPSNASFSCSANGLPRPSITWLRVVSGSLLPITQSSKYTIVSTPIGEQNQTSTLMILNTSPEDATEYACHAANLEGSTVTTATLTVHGELSTAL